MRVVDAEGSACAAGEIGGVEVKGPNVFAGYWRMPDKTREEFTADGYFRTGDMGELLPNGYLRIVGRAKDLIITGGLNVYPKEIEEKIDALPGVVESAVIGMPDADFGEAVAAVVVAQPGHALTESGRDRRAAGRDRAFQGSETRAVRDGAAAQRDGQGPEEPLPRAIREALGSA